MAADKRNFSNFREFDGKISRGIYSYPIVESSDTLGHRRAWAIHIRLVVTRDGKPPTYQTIDWDMTSEALYKIAPVRAAYLDNDPAVFPKNTLAQIWTVTGVVGLKETRSIPTYVTDGKNIGKKNETTPLTQALIMARSKYLKKLQTSTKEAGQPKRGVTGEARFFPVAVHKYEDMPRDASRRIRYPAAIQRKLDGGRAVATEGAQNAAVLYSRKLKNLAGNKAILADLTVFFEVVRTKYPGAYLDGEIYKHGLSLQQIVGEMRREIDSPLQLWFENEGGLEYHIFDVFFPLREGDDGKKMSLRNRLTVLDAMFASVEGRGLQRLVKAATYIAGSVAEETDLYKRFLSENYEGSIVKNLDPPYEFGIDREIRSYQMRKRKPRHSAEYEVVGYTEGDQGKDRGAIIWILKTPSKGDKTGHEFHSTPVGMDYAARYAMFAAMTPGVFARDWRGRMMTVEYDDLSEEGVPLRAKAKGVRIID